MPWKVECRPCDDTFIRVICTIRYSKIVKTIVVLLFVFRFVSLNLIHLKKIRFTCILYKTLSFVGCDVLFVLTESFRTVIDLKLDYTLLKDCV